MYQKIIFIVKKLRTMEKHVLPKRLHTNEITYSTAQKRCLADCRILLLYQKYSWKGSSEIGNH